MSNATRFTRLQTTMNARTPTTSNAAEMHDRSSHWSAVVQRAQAAPQTLTPADVLTLQRSIGNCATVGLLSRSTRLQAKLKLGPAGDKYEQGADRVAAQVTR